MDIVNILRDKILDIVYELVEEKKLEQPLNINSIVVERPKKQHQGDYSTNAAMVLGKMFSSNPKDLGEFIKLKLSDEELIDDVSLDGPGFLNIKINSKVWHRLIVEIMLNDNRYGEVSFGSGRKVNLEFVSANPTGPLHLGHVRGAVFGDTLASLLTEVGFTVTREYYINDAGNQIEKLVDSSLLRYNELVTNKSIDIPEGLYPGEYLKEVGKILLEKYGYKLETDPKEKVFEKVRSVSLEIILEMIKNDLLKLGIEMDVFTSEKEIISGNLLTEILKILENYF